MGRNLDEIELKNLIDIKDIDFKKIISDKFKKVRDERIKF